jgi:hypothetical protein
MPVSEITSAEYSIYTALCQTDVFRFFAPAGFRVEVATSPEGSCEGFAEGFPLEGTIRELCQRRPELLDDFALRNQARARLEKRFDAGYAYDLVAPWPAPDDAVDDETEAQDQYERVRLSRIGFAPDHSLALVYFASSGRAFPRSGGGAYVLFAWADGTWRFVADALAWIS